MGKYTQIISGGKYSRLLLASPLSTQSADTLPRIIPTQSAVAATTADRQNPPDVGKGDNVVQQMLDQAEAGIGRVGKALGNTSPQTIGADVVEAGLGAFEAVSSPIALLNPLLAEQERLAKAIPVVGEHLSIQKHLSNISEMGATAGGAISEAFGDTPEQVARAREIGSAAANIGLLGLGKRGTRDLREARPTPFPIKETVPRIVTEAVWKADRAIDRLSEAKPYEIPQIIGGSTLESLPLSPLIGPRGEPLAITDVGRARAGTTSSKGIPFEGGSGATRGLQVDDLTRKLTLLGVDPQVLRGQTVAGLQDMLTEQQRLSGASMPIVTPAPKNVIPYPVGPGISDVVAGLSDQYPGKKLYSTEATAEIGKRIGVTQARVLYDAWQGGKGKKKQIQHLRESVEGYVEDKFGGIDQKKKLTSYTEDQLRSRLEWIEAGKDPKDFPAPLGPSVAPTAAQPVVVVPSKEWNVGGVVVKKKGSQFRVETPGGVKIFSKQYQAVRYARKISTGGESVAPPVPAGEVSPTGKGLIPQAAYKLPNGEIIAGEKHGELQKDPRYTPEAESGIVVNDTFVSVKQLEEAKGDYQKAYAAAKAEQAPIRENEGTYTAIGGSPYPEKVIDNPADMAKEFASPEYRGFRGEVTGALGRRGLKATSHEDAAGVWYKDDGTRVIEPSTRIVVDDATNSPEAVAAEIGMARNQQSMYIFRAVKGGADSEYAITFKDFDSAFEAMKRFKDFGISGGALTRGDLTLHIGDIGGAGAENILKFFKDAKRKGEAVDAVRTPGNIQFIDKSEYASKIAQGKTSVPTGGTAVIGSGGMASPPSGSGAQPPTGPALQSTIVPGAKEFIEQDVAPKARAALQNLVQMGDSIRKTFAPATRGPEAGKTASSIRIRAAELARRKAITIKTLDESKKYFDVQRPSDQMNFIDAVETGAPLSNPIESRAAGVMRHILDRTWAEVQDVSGSTAFILNYFPHIWKDPIKAAEVFAKIYGKRPLEGPKTFFKRRTMPTVKEGLAHGLELATTNPAELVSLKLHEMNRYLTAQKIWGDLKDNGIVKFVRFGDRAPQGYIKVNDKLGRVFQYSEGEKGFILRGDYYMPEQAGTVLNNYLSPGLGGSAVYRTFRGVANFMNQVQLGMSAFHLYFTSNDAAISKMALSFQNFSQGKYGAGILRMAEVPIAPFENYIRGSKILVDYFRENPETPQMIDALTRAGGRVQMDVFYKNSAAEGFWKALRGGNIPGAALRTPGMLAESMAKPIMEVIVPRQKLGVFSDMAKDILGDEAAGKLTREQATARLQEAWDSVDNRMGQLVYDNLFWNRALKDLGLASVRSLGWNIGTIREIGGAATDLPTQILHTFKGEGFRLTPKMAYTISLPIVMGIQGSILHYLFTGEAPKEMKDYYFPKTGKTNPDGTEERVSLPSYMRDLYAYKEQPLTTLEHKIHPLVSSMAQMFENEDYYGVQIRNPDDPAVKQMQDEIVFWGKQFIPFSVRNLQQRKEAGGSTGAQIQGFFGITPAPRYIDRTAAEKMTTEFLKARGDFTVTQESAEKRNFRNEFAKKLTSKNLTDTDWKKADEMGLLDGGIDQGIVERITSTPQQRALKMLTAEEALKVYGVMNERERKSALPILIDKISNSDHPEKLIPQLKLKE